MLFQSNILFLASHCSCMFKCLQIEILSGIWTWLMSITKQTFYTCLLIHFVLLLIVYHKFQVGNTFSHNEFRLGNSLSHNRCGQILFHFKTSICLLLYYSFQIAQVIQCTYFGVLPVLLFCDCFRFSSAVSPSHKKGDLETISLVHTCVDCFSSVSPV